MAAGAVAVLCSDNLDAGTHLDAHAMTPEWDGTPLNLHHAIEVMHPLAWRPSPRRMDVD